MRYLLLATLTLAACSGSTSSSTEECPEGQARAFDGFCHDLCASTAQCGDCEVCADGFCIGSSECQEVTCDEETPCPAVACKNVSCVNNTCVETNSTSTEACDDENPCTENDACDGAGTCTGTAVVCGEPPTNSCDDNNDKYLSYPNSGVCVPAAGDSYDCEYTPQEFDCGGNCETNCLNACDAILPCPVHANECLEGYCEPNPGSSPSCQYAAKEGTPACITDGDVQADGVCLSGVCTDCRDVSECTQPPGDDVCYSKTCTDGACGYTLNNGATCAAQSCSGSTKTLAWTCSGEGLCTTGASSACPNGFACNDEGTDCQTVCIDNADCASTHYCDQGACVQRLANGATGCNDDDDRCQVGSYCECGDATCSSLSMRCTTAQCQTCRYASGGTSCNGYITDGTATPSVPGCTATGYSCYSGTCKKDNGQSCSLNADCGNTCINGFCANRSGNGGACDNNTKPTAEREGDCTGSTSMRCSGTTTGTCQNCAVGTSDCGNAGSCIYLNTNDNCGGCGNTCGGITPQFETMAAPVADCIDCGTGYYCDDDGLCPGGGTR